LESIRQAVDLARGEGGILDAPGAVRRFPNGPGSVALDAQIRDVHLNAAHLEAMRIVAQGSIHFAHGRYYDMLRTQVLQEMDKHGWQFLAVTSATPACGKSVTSCNLALSIARLAEQSVLLVDLDLLKPKISEYLGLNCRGGVLSVLEERATLPSKVVQACFGRSKVLVLPGEVCKSGSAEWMASQTMATLLQTIRRDFRSRIVIFDLPPLLIGDDVISILPLMDAVLLVTAVGNTILADIKECRKHLKETPVVRVIVNKVTETPESNYSYY
jgi:protein-tyrosine kinase